ncbi:MAG TPA: HesB-like protein [Clostridiales bacterium]|nr:HesB-like protein [Clostridiales bacterium]
MIFINDQAYDEFKVLLDDAEVESYNIRIGISNYSCSGPVFGVYVEEPTDKDDVERIKDITFIVDKELNQQYGGFIIVSNEENNGNGVGLMPVVQPSSSCGDGCGGCGGGCN